jgi:hypothetical protein
MGPWLLKPAVMGGQHLSISFAWAPRKIALASDRGQPKSERP